MINPRQDVFSNLIHSALRCSGPSDAVRLKVLGTVALMVKQRHLDSGAPAASPDPQSQPQAMPVNEIHKTI